MRFASTTKNLMDILIPLMDKSLKRNKSSLQKKKLDSLLRIFYIHMKRSENSYNDMITDSLYRNLIPTYKDDSILSNTLLQSRFVCSHIRSHITKSIKYSLEYKFIIHEKRVNVVIGLDNVRNISKYDGYVKKIIQLMYFIYQICPYECISPLTITLFPTLYKKTLPLSELLVLGPSHVNSAVTTNCSVNNDILIYRNEEWFKVLIHELFHSLNMDFSYLDYSIVHRELKELFNIRSSFNAFEAYSEFWALIINCLFCSYTMMDSNDKFESFAAYFELCIQFEKIFATFQAVKILKFMNLEYRDLYGTKIGSILYKEKSNVFSYYILKMILLNNYEEFIPWCYFNNEPNIIKFTPSNKSLKSFADFVARAYKNKNVTHMIHLVQPMYNKLRIKYDNKNLSKYETMLFKTCRMSLCEML